MSQQLLKHLPRRLPVFFLLDTSVAMAGTLQVALQEGCRVVRHELAVNDVASRHVYLSAVTFGEKAILYRLAPVNAFVPPTWDAQGYCKLEPAVKLLVEAFNSELIASRHERPGDYNPIIFCILGGSPLESWLDMQIALDAFVDNKRPLIIILLTHAELARSMKALSKYIYLLQPAEAIYLNGFFFWIVLAITKICESCVHGVTTIDLPPLPNGIIVLH